jgi:F0F1-type ATP synthase membrane subunit b/b'
MAIILLAFAENSIQLVPDGTLILHVVIIVVMVMVLNATLLKPINVILERRDQESRGLLEKARQTFAAIERRLAECEQKLRAARTEGYRLMEIQRTEAIREREAAITATKELLGKSIAAEKDVLGVQVADARGKLAIEARDMGLKISAQILGRQVSS